MKDEVTQRPDAETARIRRVYRSYKVDPASARRWDPSSSGNKAIVEERRQAVRRLLDLAGVTSLDDRRILDVGCGSGGALRDWLALGASAKNLYGADLLGDRLREAGPEPVNPAFCCADARALPFPDGTFDLISAFTLFSSVIDPNIAAQIATELRRVSAHGGRILWYDLRYPNPRNPNLRALGRRHIAALFPDDRMKLVSITLLPPVARRLHRGSRHLYGWLAKIPALRSHYLGLIRLVPTSLKGPE